MKVSLKSIAPLRDQDGGPRPVVFESTYEARAGELYGAAASDWVIVYGDKEHSANLAFVCGFDPRFEEAILVLGKSGKRVLVLGNEGLGYSSKCRLRADVALCQSFSLMGQSRGRRSLRASSRTSPFGDFAKKR